MLRSIFKFQLKLCQSCTFQAILEDISSQKTEEKGYLQSRMRMQSKMATSAPVLSPAELVSASALHNSILPFRSHVHTRIVSVPVLLCMGKCPSEITTATRCVLLCIRPNPLRRVKIPAVLSVESGALSLLGMEENWPLG